MLALRIGGSGRNAAAPSAGLAVDSRTYHFPLPMTCIKGLMPIPETIGKEDFVLRLAEGHSVHLFGRPISHEPLQIQGLQKWQPR